MRGWACSAFVFALVVAASACEGGKRTIELRSHAIAANGAVNSSCRASAEILCNRAAACAPDYVPFFFQTHDACVEQVAARCAQRYEGPGAADAPDICEGAATAPCSSIADPESAVLAGPADVLLFHCEVAAGRFAVGEHCLRDGDCQSGACAVDQRLRELRAPACGSCAASAGVMEPCSRTTGEPRCRAGLTCIEDRCRRIVGEGERCDDTTACSTECHDGVCVKLGVLGEACVEHGCDLTHRFACGEPEKRCGEVTVAAPGEACDGFGQARPGMRFCDFRSWCSNRDGGAGVCEKRDGFGEACSKDSCHPTFDCVDGFCGHPPARSTCKPDESMER